jgi:hypothetical protein
MGTFGLGLAGTCDEMIGYWSAGHFSGPEQKLNFNVSVASSYGVDFG